MMLTVILLCSCSEHTADIPTEADIPVQEEIPPTDIPLEQEATAEEPELEPEPEPEHNPKNDEYFNSSLFVGDSIMEGVRQYVARERKNTTVLGDAKFVTTTVGISIADLTGYRDEGIYFSYKGKEQTIEEILSVSEAKRVFFMLGLNDLAAGFDNQVTADRYLELIKNIRRILPNLEIIVISNPPKVASSWLPAYVENREFDNELILDFVTRVKLACEENAIEYVDIHTPLCNENGALDDENCRDGYVHLNDAGSEIVVDALYKFAECK